MKPMSSLANQNNNNNNYLGHNDDAWEVSVFRRTIARGWERLNDQTNDMINGTQDNTTKIIESMEGPTLASPRKGCVEIRKLRLRINLFQRPKPPPPPPPPPPPVMNDSTGTKSNEKNSENDEDNHPLRKKRNLENVPNSKEEEQEGTQARKFSRLSSTSSQLEDHANKVATAVPNNNKDSSSSSSSSGYNTLVVRRMDTILLSTRRGMGAVVLKFPSKFDCIAFTDRLTELNANYFNNHNNSASDFVGNSVYVPSPLCPTTAFGQHNDDDDDDDKKTRQLQQQQQQQQQQRDVQSYVVRLMHDREFQGFVRRMESFIMSSPDMGRMLDAMGTYHDSLS